jgi:tetratricopeptide (TPR) repeat protein
MATANTRIFGRENDLATLFSDLEKDEKTIRLVVGESGVGKSFLLDNFFHQIIEKESNNQTNGNISYFIGYYSKKNSLASESLSEEYPVHVALSNLVENIRKSQPTEERQKAIVNRFAESLKEFAKQEGKQVAKDIATDLLKQVRLEKTVSYAERFWNIFKGKKTSVANAEEILKERKQILDIYSGIFNSIAQEFSERTFVIIFDQIESVGKSSLDFLFNLIKFLTDKFHIFLAFKIEETWEDQLSKTLFDYTDNMVRNLNGVVSTLNELTIDDIDLWIQYTRNRTLPRKDLVGIKEYSGELPIILEPWIKESTELNYQEIHRDDHCQQLLKLRKGLSDEDQTRLSKLSIMLYPSRDEFIAKNYLEFPTLGNFHPFDRKMEDKGIFERVSENTSWFKHELIKYCFESELYSDEKKEYNKILVEYYAGLKEHLHENGSQTSEYENRYKIDISYCYHLHNAGLYAESFNQNIELANYAGSLGDLDIAERSYRQALYAASQDKSIPKSERMKCLFSLTRNVLSFWGRYDEAMKNYSDLLDYYNNVANEEGIATALNLIGFIHDNKGEYDEALKRYEDSLKISRKLGDQEGIAMGLHDLGRIHYIKGEYDEAIKGFEESLEIFRKLGDQERMIAIALHNIGSIHYNKGEYDEALKRYEDSLEISRKFGHKRGIAFTLNTFTLNNIGRIYEDKGKYDEALKRYEDSLEISRKLGNQEGIASALNGIGRIHENKGEYDEALKRYEDSLEISRKLGHKKGIASALNGIGRIHSSKGEYDEALKRYEESLEISRKLGDQPRIADTLEKINSVKKKL